MTGWSLDLGTTNSGVAQWDPNRSQPQLVELAGVCRSPDGEDPLEAPRLVPSAVHILDKPRLIDRLGSWPPLAPTRCGAWLAHCSTRRAVATWRRSR